MPAAAVHDVPFVFTNDGARLRGLCCADDSRKITCPR